MLAFHWLINMVNTAMCKILVVENFCEFGSKSPIHFYPPIFVTGFAKTSTHTHLISQQAVTLNIALKFTHAIEE